MNMLEKLHLKIFGWYQVTGTEKYMINCDIHGLTTAYIHGFRNKIDCIKCIQEERELREIANKQINENKNPTPIKKINEYIITTKCVNCSDKDHCLKIPFLDCVHYWKVND